jgi:tRNA nucleotidyltransferase (CCA-adding enzyme)
MEIYEVGGAVRDSLLGLPRREVDWVVVGGSVEEMLRLGYRPVGKDFPVFLHPQSGEQYALARTERKVAPGYHGFEFNAAPDVTLEQDLARRDLTINAMARGADGEIIDPYGGRADLAGRVLRHVSEAFREDPVRVLRAARFAARFAELGFTIAPETMALMRAMSHGGEIDALRPERVWQETDRALAEPRPDVYFRILRRGDALGHVFPELDALFGVPQPARWHPEIDTGEHTLLALRVAARISDHTAVRFAVMTHDLGKATSPKELLPKHRGHEERSVRAIEQLAARLPVPRRYRELALHVARYHGLVHRARELRPSTVYKLIEAVDAIRRPERFEDFLLACEADARGRAGLGDRPYPQAQRLRVALKAALGIDASRLTGGLEGEAVGAAIRKGRLDAITRALSE